MSMRRLRLVMDWISDHAYTIAFVSCAFNAVILFGPIHAEDKKPALTELQYLRVQTIALKIDNAQKAQQLAQVELRDFVASITPSGYDFNVQAAINGQDPFVRKVEEKAGEKK